jgi:hypothetical protein
VADLAAVAAITTAGDRDRARNQRIAAKSNSGGEVPTRCLAPVASVTSSIGPGDGDAGEPVRVR